MILPSRRMIGFAMTVSVAIAVGDVSAQAAPDTLLLGVAASHMVTPAWVNGATERVSIDSRGRQSDADSYSPASRPAGGSLPLCPSQPTSSRATGTTCRTSSFTTGKLATPAV